MIKSVEKTMLEHNMLPFKSVLVGLSGGADSAALAHALCVLSKKYGFKVCAAHVNHGLRGETAERDEKFPPILPAVWELNFSACMHQCVRKRSNEK